MKVNANTDHFENNILAVFQFFNGWLDVCMNYIYRITWDAGDIWIVEECHITAEEICPLQNIYGIGNVKLETMCPDRLIERTFSRKSLRK